MEHSRFASGVSVLQVVTFMQETCSGRIKAPLSVKFSNSIRFFYESQNVIACKTYNYLIWQIF